MVHPRFLESACERRNSICVSPLGRGPSGGWRAYAELDFWEVWNRVARAYTLDRTQTILTGISMGAFGTYKIAMDHPEAFEAAVTIVGNATSNETGLDRLTNLRWIPLYARHGAADELVRIDTEIATQDALNDLGLRHVYDFHPAEDHIVVALKDAYDDVAEWMMGIDELRAAGTLNATDVPPVITWALKAPRDGDVRDFESSHRINRPGAWWLQRVTRRDGGAASNIDATSLAISNPPVTPVQYDEPRVLASPSPAVRHILRWDYGTALETAPEVTVDLVNIATLTIDLDQAGLEEGPATITIETDGPVTVTLVRNGNVVAGPSNFGAGQHTIEIEG
jgi:pimeloyl-ACP methyl ester carboxylesterase